MKYTEMWGKPEGNELIWGRLILRMVGVHRFKKVAYFDNYLDAQSAFNEWLKENDSIPNNEIENSLDVEDQGLLELAEFVHRTGKK